MSHRPRAVGVTCDKTYQVLNLRFLEDQGDVSRLVRFEAEAQQKGRREPFAKLTHSDVNSIGARSRVSMGS